MRTDLKLNYGALDAVSSRIAAYYNALDDMEQALKELKSVLANQESEAVEELSEKLKSTSVNLGNKKETLRQLKQILDNYIGDMEELVGATSRNEKVRADQYDIWYNIKQIENPVDDLKKGVASAARGNSSWIPAKEEDYMRNTRRKEERNYTKLENLRSGKLAALADRMKTSVTDIWDIYNNYIKPFEEKDDDYRKKLNAIYKERTSKEDKWDNFWDSFTSIAGSFLKSFAIAFVGAFLVALAPGWLVVGALVVLAVGCVIMANVPEESVPNWLKGAKQAADDVAEKAVQVLEEGPTVLVEDIAQDFMDKIQTPEGIAAVAGETIGGFAGGYAGTKVKAKIKTKNLDVPQHDNSFDKLDTDIDEIDLPEGTWEKGVTERGKEIDKILKNNTGDNYPVIDRIDKDGVVTSVKSRDLNCTTYQNGSKLESVIKRDIDKLAKFNGKTWGGTTISPSQITGKQLQIVFPNSTLTQTQIKAINSAISYGREKGIKVLITVGR